MKKVYTSVEELIGNTPLLELTNIEQSEKLNASVYGKLECFNPAGSAKDRVAKMIIEEGIKNGEINKDTVIIEPTSGNTGIGLAAICAARGMRLIIVMPDTMSVERIKLMQAYGAELVLSDGSKGMAGAIEKAEELSREIKGSIIAGQFTNPANPKAHFLTTGPEIYEALDGKVDIFVAGAGTGGTITGVGQYLKKMNPGVKIIAVEPANSAVLSGGKAGSHGLMGIGAGFIPEILDTQVIDEVITITDEEAYEGGRMLATKEGILTGITSGASLAAALKVARRSENCGKNIVAFFTDTGERYLSTPMFK